MYVAGASQRLIGEGLNRHDAIHAIGMVLAEHIYDVFENGEIRHGPERTIFRCTRTAHGGFNTVIHDAM